VSFVRRLTPCQITLEGATDIFCGGQVDVMFNADQQMAEDGRERLGERLAFADYDGSGEGDVVPPSAFLRGGRGGPNRCALIPAMFPQELLFRARLCGQYRKCIRALPLCAGGMESRIIGGGFEEPVETADAVIGWRSCDDDSRRGDRVSFRLGILLRLR
jgi:hypothetical protein